MIRGCHCYLIQPRRLAFLSLLCAFACGSGERTEHAVKLRLVKRASQAKFKPENFTFAKLQVQDGERDGIFATCLHVPLFDASQKTYDCDIGVTLPIFVYGETWPRDEDDAARYVTRAFNGVRGHLLGLEHADSFTCGAYYRQVRAFLRGSDKRRRKIWAGADTMRCTNYQGTRLPEFYFRSGRLLIGDYREWSKQ